MAANYVLLERIELNASAASVTFSNIPQSGYTDLKIVCSTRLDSATGATFNFVRFNGVTTGYSFKSIEGSGSAAASAGASTANAGLDEGTSYTANTFSSTDIYIPNYTSSNYKSYSVDTVTENNATSAYMELVAGLWSNSAAITSVQILPDTGGRNYVANSTFSLYGIAATGTTPAVAPKATGGNMVSTDGTYWYHTFLTSGTFTPQTALTCDYLVVAGGGGTITSASEYYSGGGGGGGLRSSVSPTGGGASPESPLSLSAQNYTVTIGAGAAATASGRYGIQGNNSTFGAITSIGGGYGSTGPGATSGPGGNGGSGGGAGSNNGSPYTVYSGGTGTTGQGYNGGSNESADAYAAGAGGGAGGAGGNGSSGKGGTGGAAVQNSISGTATYYAGGGWGGRGFYGAATRGDSGTGYNQNRNTGMGGVATNAAGQSGIVIIRYAM